MECWSELVAQPKPSAIQQAQQLAYIKYTAPSDPASTHRSTRTVITSESRGLILSGGTTGFRTWEAALHLGSFLATPTGAALVRGKRVIELGAGTGFLSIFCARHLDVQDVVVTDREQALIDHIRDCMVRNQLDGKAFHPAIWEWGTPLTYHDDDNDAAAQATEVPEQSGMVFDVALGADLVCFPFSFFFADPLLSSTESLEAQSTSRCTTRSPNNPRFTTSTSSRSWSLPSVISSTTTTSKNSSSPQPSATKTPSKHSSTLVVSPESVLSSYVWIHDAKTNPR